MKYLLTIGALIMFLNSSGQGSDEKEIRQILDHQTNAWNKGDIEKFMKGYWENDSLMFIGKSGVTYGYKNTLNNYKKNYPTTADMGKLSFTLISVKKLSDKYYHIVGKWLLERTKDNLQGHYTLLFQKVDGKWVIIMDHSS